MSQYSQKTIVLESFFNKVAAGLQLCERQTPTKAFSCEYCKIFKSIYFEEHQRTTAYAQSIHN